MFTRLLPNTFRIVCDSTPIIQILLVCMAINSAFLMRKCATIDS